METKPASGQSVQRYYDPMIPRFLSVDPVTAYSDPIGAFHRYRYANNNPYRFTDPDGRQSAADRWSDTVAKVHKEGRQSELEPLVIPAAIATAVMLAPVVAVVGAEVGIAALANPGAVATATTIAAETAGVTGVAGATVVTATKVGAALAGSSMQTTQRAVSLPVVQRYVNALENGSSAPAIKVADGVIVDGNHRYVAGRIAGREPAIQPAAISPGQASQARPIQEIKVDPKDWGDQ